MSNPSESAGPLIVTRAAEDQPALAMAFAQAGWRTYPLPLLAFVPGSERERFTEAFADSDGGWVMLTSTRALGALQEARSHSEAGGELGWQLGCVGESTATAVRDGGFLVATVGPGTGAQSLLRRMIELLPRPKSGRILWPTSDRAATDVSGLALREGLLLERFEVYRTQIRPADAAHLEAAIQTAPRALVLWSPSAVEAWLSSLASAPAGLRQRAEALDLLVPGETTAAACRAAAAKERLRGRLLIAQEPTPAGLAARLETLK